MANTTPEKYRLNSEHRPNLAVRLARFIASLAMLLALVGFLASGQTTPGVLGEVVRHNQANDIDASPLIYSDVENMAQLEAAVRTMRQDAVIRTDSLCGSAAE